MKKFQAIQYTLPAIIAGGVAVLMVLGTGFILLSYTTLNLLCYKVAATIGGIVTAIVGVRAYRLCKKETAVKPPPETPLEELELLETLANESNEYGFL
ncbi:MAG: hypothetical protein WCG84_01375 [Candidatus Moraniibacteriota bacterium]